MNLTLSKENLIIFKALKNKLFYFKIFIQFVESSMHKVTRPDITKTEAIIAYGILSF